MPQCSMCAVEHSRMAGSRFASYCAACHAKYMREHRPKHSELAPDARRKANARATANVYQRRGKLAPAPCERCGSGDVQKHHEDYTKPLEVRWLCRECHHSLHRDVS